MNRIEDLLCELIARPSVNPAFLPSSHPFAGEHVVAEFLAERARKAGLDVDFQKVSGTSRNLLLCLSPKNKRKSRILLVPHLDTVGGEPLPGSLFTPRRKGGHIHGRGACDTKGSVAVMFAALCDLATSAQRPEHTEIVFAGLCDEEEGQTGSRALVQSGFSADLAIVGEPTLLKVVTAHKGVSWLKLVTRGKAAHGARPELGRNAVHHMARIVDVLETRYRAELRRRKRHPLLGFATINVGSIAGGCQPNIVPDRCVISIDRRLLPGENDTSVVAELKALLRRNRLRATIERSHKAPCQPLENNPEAPLTKMLMNMAGQKAPAAVDFFSDAGVLAAGGISSVLFGPGNIAQAHIPDEWVSIKQLERGQAILRKFLQSLS